MKVLLATTMVLGVIFTLGTNPLDATVLQPGTSAKVQSHVTPAGYYYYGPAYGPVYGPAYGPAFGPVIGFGPGFYSAPPLIRVGPIGIL